MRQLIVFFLREQLRPCCEKVGFPEEKLQQLIYSYLFLGSSCDPAARKWWSLRSCDSYSFFLREQLRPCCEKVVFPEEELQQLIA